MSRNESRWITAAKFLPGGIILGLFIVCAFVPGLHSKVAQPQPIHDPGPPVLPLKLSEAQQADIKTHKRGPDVIYAEDNGSLGDRIFSVYKEFPAQVPQGYLNIQAGDTEWCWNDDTRDKTWQERCSRYSAGGGFKFGYTIITTRY